jgi:hypothetical protein
MAATAAPALAAGPADPIKTVEVGKNREFIVNGKPFLPIMLFSQDIARIPDGLSISANTFVENVSDVSSREFLDKLQANGLRAVVHFEDGLAGHPALLGYIHGDEPDNRSDVSDADIVAGQGTRVGRNAPLWRMVDGDGRRAASFDSLEGAQFTIKLDKPATAVSLAVTLALPEQAAAAKEVEFLADGKSILKATLEKKADRQRFDLKEPATFTELTVKVLSTYPGERASGSIAEVEAFDAAGKDVLLAKPRTVPRQWPEEIAPYYQKAKQVEPSRPVFVTLCASFMKNDQTFDEALKARIYPAYVKLCDVVGFDIYPIFGTNYPSQLDYVAEGVGDLVALAGPRPVYAWIETNTGSQWITPSRQVPLKPMHTRAEVWMAIVRGATAIGYFTHKWRDPDGKDHYMQFAPEGEMVVELKRLDEQLTRLAPAILADPAKARISMTLGDKLACHFKATQHEGALYIFAQNIDLGANKDTLRQGEDITPRGGKAVISVEGLKAGTAVEVVDEARTITAEDGKFSDEFAPLAEHIYRIKL